MSFLRALISGVTIWVFLNPISVFAESHNHEAQHQKKISSPFESKKQDVSLHCLLKLHIQHGYCPHSNSMTENKIPFSIASDCGGKTSGAIPNTATFNYDFAEANSVLLITNCWKSAFTSDHFFVCHGFNDSLSPPPRTI